MPTVLRRNGFLFLIFPNDHRPPHVHVFKAGGMVVLELGSGAVRKAYAMKSPMIAEAKRLVLANHSTLLAQWERIHD